MDRQARFTAGPRLGDVEGDPSRQAVAALRGYAFQLYATALAWVELDDTSDLYVEVAEDYAIATKNALNAVQLKDTEGSGTLTINNKGVRDTIDAFVDLVTRNPGRRVSVRYLTTSSVGVERALRDRISNSGALDYWRKAASSGDVTPLRNLLLRCGLSTRTKEHIESLDDAAFRFDFLRRLHWDCGHLGVAGVQYDLSISLKAYGASHGIPASECARLSGPILQRALNVASTEGTRRLTAAELSELVDAATRISLPRGALDNLLKVIDAPGSAQAIAPANSIIESVDELPLPTALSPRSELVHATLMTIADSDVGWVVGATGMGKTILARLAARSHGGNWGIVEFRDATPDSAAERLQSSQIALVGSNWNGLIFDDLNVAEHPNVGKALARLLAAIRRRDMTCLVTSYREPSNRLRSELGTSGKVSVVVPDLTVKEVARLVSESGGDPAQWASIVYAAGAFGHPQLVQSVIAGLRTRSWPDAELQRLLRLDLFTEDAAAERRTARTLLEAAPDAAKTMAYRTSLIMGRFNRGLALTLGSVAPVVPRPGEQLDFLVGPWIDLVGRDRMRVSPLLSNAGAEVLGPAEQHAVHVKIAEDLTSTQSINMADGNVALLHALKCKAQVPLGKIAFSIVRVDRDVRKALATWMLGLRACRTEAPIFEENAALSILLRLAQVLLIADMEDSDNLRLSWRALLTEVESLPRKGKEDHLEYLVLSKALLDDSTAGLLPDWVDLLTRFDALTKTHQIYREIAHSITTFAVGERSFSLTGFLFINQAIHLKSVSDLASVFDVLDRLPENQRDRLLADVGSHVDSSIVLNAAWLSEHDSAAVDGAANARAYLRMAEQALSWKKRNLAARCYVVRSIMLDEYQSKPEEALAALDEARTLCGPDWSISRARAKILYRHRDHAGALGQLREIADAAPQDDPIERAFLLREGAISAAQLGHWGEAQEWFEKAMMASNEATIDDSRVMAAGLRGDGFLRSASIPTSRRCWRLNSQIGCDPFGRPSQRTKPSACADPGRQCQKLNKPWQPRAALSPIALNCC